MITPRHSTSVLALAACFALALPASPGALASDGAAAWDADIGVGYLSGDYGTDFDTELFSFTTRLRRQFSRGEIRVSLPYVNLTSEGEVTIVDGRPVRTPDALPGLPGFPGPPAPSASETSVSGVGDAKLRGELHVVQGTDSRPWVSVVAQVKAPTADEAEGLGTGETDLTGGVGVVYPLGRVSALVDASFTKMGDPEGFDFEDVLAYGGGLSWRIGASAKQRMFVYAESRESPFVGEEDRVDAALGANGRFGANEAFKLSASVIVGLSDSTEDYGVAVAVGRSF